MTKSKKLIISLSIALAVVVIALVTVVSVWAATSQTVTNQLTVRYTASNVSATVKADYKLANASAYTSIGTASFAASEGNSTSKSISAKEIELTDSATYVVFRYTFTNTGSNTITVSLDMDNLPTATNMTVEYSLSTLTSNLQGDEKEPNYQIDGPTTEPVFPDPPIPGGGRWKGTLDIAGGATDEVYIKVAITSQASDATYSGTLHWTLANKTT